jgi:hypothetical protein
VNALNLTISGHELPYVDTMYRTLETFPGEFYLYSQGEHYLYRELLHSPSNLCEVLAEIDLRDEHGAGLGDFFFRYQTKTTVIFAGNLISSVENTFSFHPYDTSAWDWMTMGMPPIHDTSKWNWSMNIAANRVPESGGLLCLALGAGLLLFFKPRKEKAWTS